jgi:hypothetical protein
MAKAKSCVGKPAMDAKAMPMAKGKAVKGKGKKSKKVKK